MFESVLEDGDLTPFPFDLSMLFYNSYYEFLSVTDGNSFFLDKVNFIFKFNVTEK